MKKDVFIIEGRYESKIGSTDVYLILKLSNGKEKKIKVN